MTDAERLAPRRNAAFTCFAPEIEREVLDRIAARLRRGGGVRGGGGMSDPFGEVRHG